MAADEGRQEGANPARQALARHELIHAAGRRGILLQLGRFLHCLYCIDGRSPDKHELSATDAGSKGLSSGPAPSAAPARHGRRAPKDNGGHLLREDVGLRQGEVQPQCILEGRADES